MVGISAIDDIVAHPQMQSKLNSYFILRNETKQPKIYLIYLCNKGAPNAPQDKFSAVIPPLSKAEKKRLL